MAPVDRRTCTIILRSGGRVALWLRFRDNMAGKSHSLKRWMLFNSIVFDVTLVPRVLELCALGKLTGRLSFRVRLLRVT